MTDTMTETAAALRGILTRWAQPDPKTVSQLPKGGTKLDFVGHAEITRILIEEDPLWSWEPAAWTEEGAPAIVERGKHFALWGRMTVHGKTLPCVGTCETGKLDRGSEVDKELISDLIRNGAMRFGIAINLWSKERSDEDYVPAEPSPAVPEEYFGWHSQAAHDDWWQRQADILRQLPDGQRDDAVQSLIDARHFALSRKPSGPFHHDHRGEVEAIIARAVAQGAASAAVDSALSRVVTELRSVPEPEHSAHAIDVMAEALNIDDPLNPPDGVVIDDAAWDLAEVEDLDAHNWKATGKAIKWRDADIVKRAQEVALDIAAPQPARLDDIHGALAVELRNSILRSSASF